jgi:predicted extracellular nuclease
VQYQSAAGTNPWQLTPLTGVIQPGGLFLVAEAAGSGGTQDLPSPDVTGSIPMSATNGIVALVNTSTALTCGQGCLGDPSIVDLVGFGTAQTFEGGAAAPALTNTTSATRVAGPDTDDNAADFVAGQPSPREVPVTSTNTLVINEVYGGGGNSGATWRRDFIELENRGTQPLDLTGWTVQYHAATTDPGAWSATALTGTIAPGGRYLIAEAAGSGGTQDLPSPDVTGTIAMAAGAGIVALVDSPDTLTCAQACLGNEAIVDLVGYGNALTFEGSAAAPTLTNTTSASRVPGADTDDKRRRLRRR